MGKAKSTRKRSFHTFTRYSHEDIPPQKIKALIKAGTGIITIRLREEHVRKAMRQKGFADSQNCAGAVCTVAHAKNFQHPVVGTIDWWRNRVFILSNEYTKNNDPICYVYAHYDDTEALFDATIHDLQKLLNKVQKHGYIDITLYPAKRGRHSKTGRATSPSGPGGSGGHKKRRIGSDLRWDNFMRARPLAATSG